MISRVITCHGGPRWGVAVRAAVAGGLVVMLLAGCVNRTRGQTQSAGDTDRVSAQSEPVEPETVEVSTRDIDEAITMDGVVETYPPVDVVAAAAGEFVPTAKWNAGADVQAGGRLGTITTTTCVEADTQTAGTGSEKDPESPAEPSCTSKVTTVVAPVGGTLTAALVEREVGEQEALGAVQPPGHRVRLTADQPETLYRLRQPPMTARASIVGGPEGLDLVYEGTAYDPGSGAVSVLGRLPDDAEVFAGLHCIGVLVTARRQGVHVLPVSAVKGKRDRGRVVVLDDSGNMHGIDVRLGVSDREYVEVEGVPEGARIVRFPLESEFDG